MITTTDDCTTGQTEVATACYNSGLDAYTAAACYASLPATFETACVTAVSTLGAYTSKAVFLTVGCAVNTPAPTSALASPVLSDTSGLYGLPCSFYDSVIAEQFPTGMITSTDDCTTGQTEVATACYNSGLDAYTAAACYASLPAMFETACVTAVSTLGAYTSKAVFLAVGCAVNTPAPTSALEKGVSLESEGEVD